MPKRYILALIVISIIFFGGLFLLLRLVTGGDDTDNSQNTSQTQKVNKLSNDAESVSYTIYGNLVAEEDRRAIRVTVSSSERRLEVLRGYDEAVIKRETLSNKESAFTNLLLALEQAKFTTRDSAITQEDRGLCPLGYRYVFQTYYEDNSNVRSWLTSCDVKNSSFKGDSETVHELFVAQIPNYEELVKDVNFKL